MNKIAGMVVLYNPEDEAIAAVTSWIDQVECVYVVDNSTQLTTAASVLKGMKKVIYLSMGRNSGVAMALNTAATAANRDGFEWLLTMDQDTLLPPDFVACMQRETRDISLDPIAIFAPVYPGSVKNPSTKVEAVLLVPTSGNLLNLATYRTIGGFMEKLFIDHVDHEYCLRLRAKGLLVMQVNAVTLEHFPGVRRRIPGFFGRHFFSSGDPIRAYYFCRNGLFVSALYKTEVPEFKRVFTKLLFKEFLKIPFEQNRIKKVRMLWRGMVDFRKGISGPAGATPEQNRFA